MLTSSPILQRKISDYTIIIYYTIYIKLRVTVVLLVLLPTVRLSRLPGPERGMSMIPLLYSRSRRLGWPTHRPCCHLQSGCLSLMLSSFWTKLDNFMAIPYLFMSKVFQTVISTDWAEATTRTRAFPSDKLWAAVRTSGSSLPRRKSKRDANCLSNKKTVFSAP